ncbi:hypothetical protein OIV83_003804 [Microbotryomycetes sp. JL201]|nr:hypothetical protein OIV83_003804 [Microbotryomycetes sp. JL201]
MAPVRRDASPRDASSLIEPSCAGQATLSIPGEGGATLAPLLVQTAQTAASRDARNLTRDDEDAWQDVHGDAPESNVEDPAAHFSAAFNHYVERELPEQVRKRLQNSREKKTPYLDNSFWIRQPDRAFLLNRAKLPTPGELLLPDVLLVFPKALNGGNQLKCVAPLGEANDAGLPSLCATKLDRHEYYKCRACKKTVVGTDPGIIAQLPPYIANALTPYIATHKAALDALSLKIGRFGFANGARPEAFAAMIREIQLQTYDEIRRDYSLAVKYRNAANDRRNFPPLDSLPTLKWPTPVPKAQWLRDQAKDANSRTELMEENAPSLARSNALRADIVVLGPALTSDTLSTIAHATSRRACLTRPLLQQINLTT